MKTKLYRLLSIVLAMAMLVSLGVSHADDAGKYYPSFTNMTDAKAAAVALTTELAAEGDVLLKNDGALPLRRGAWVSVFGVTSDSLTGASDSAGAWSGSSEGGDTLAAALESAGYKVNPTLNPGGTDTPFWGTRAVDRSKLMQAEDVVDVILFVIDHPKMVFYAIDFESATRI